MTTRKQKKKMSHIMNWSTLILHNQEILNMTMESFEQYNGSQERSHLIRTCQLLVYFAVTSLPELELERLIPDKLLNSFEEMVSHLLKDFDTLMQNLRKEHSTENNNNNKIKNCIELFEQVNISMDQLEVISDLVNVIFGKLILNHKNGAIQTTLSKIYRKKIQAHLDHAIKNAKKINHYINVLNKSIIISDKIKSKELSIYDSIERELLVVAKVNEKRFVLTDLSVFIDNKEYNVAILNVMKHIYSRRENNGKAMSLAKEYVSLRNALVDAPQNGYIHWLLARNYEEQKQYSAAGRTFMTAAELLPKGHFLLHSCYYRAAQNILVDWNNDPEYTELQIQIQQQQQRLGINCIDEHLAQQVSDRIKPIKQLYQKGEQAEEDNKYLIKRYLYTHPQMRTFLCSPDGAKSIVKEKIEMRQKIGVSVPLSELKSTMCRNCQKQQKELKRCKSCQSVFYCGSNCQKEDWPRHKTECKQLTLYIIHKT
jgi:tetratricopeptide (TPR) repeat protein